MILKIVMLVRILGSLLIGGAFLAALSEAYLHLALRLAWLGVLFIFASCVHFDQPQKKHPV